jgi:imidazolonepropionase-like amidohydrolase
MPIATYSSDVFDSASGLLRDSYTSAKRARVRSAVQERGLVLLNCRVLDAASGSVSSNPTDVLIRAGKIAAVGNSADFGAQIADEDSALVVDCGRRVLMPG